MGLTEGERNNEQAVRLRYRCRACGEIFQRFEFPNSAEAEDAFRSGGEKTPQLHSCSASVTGIGEQIGWEMVL